MTPYNKITVGFVVQEFDENCRCVAQEFIAGDDVSYEGKEYGDEVANTDLDFIMDNEEYFSI